MPISMIVLLPATTVRRVSPVRVGRKPVVDVAVDAVKHFPAFGDRIDVHHRARSNSKGLRPTVTPSEFQPRKSAAPIRGRRAALKGRDRLIDNPSIRCHGETSTLHLNPLRRARPPTVHTDRIRSSARGSRLHLAARRRWHGQGLRRYTAPGMPRSRMGTANPRRDVLRPRLCAIPSSFSVPWLIDSAYSIGSLPD